MELDVTKAFLTPATNFPFDATVTLPPQKIGAETVTFDPVALRGTYSVYDHVVHVEGTLETVAHGACALCMKPADAPVKVVFSEEFRRDADELEDMCFRYDGKCVPLDHMTLTLTLLELPMRFECAESCEGVEELKAWKKNNPASSDGVEAPTQHPFEALRSLLNEEPKQ